MLSDFQRIGTKCNETDLFKGGGERCFIINQDNDYCPLEDRKESRIELLMRETKI